MWKSITTNLKIRGCDVWTAVDGTEAFNTGADDDLTRPFGVVELLAQVRGALRGSSRQKTMPPYAFRDLELDFGARRTRLAGQDVRPPHGPACDVQAEFRHSGPASRLRPSTSFDDRGTARLLIHTGVRLACCWSADWRGTLVRRASLRT